MDNVKQYRMYDVVRDSDDLRVGFLIETKNEPNFIVKTFSSGSIEDDCKNIASERNTLFTIPGKEESLKIGSEFLLFDLDSPRMLNVELAECTFEGHPIFKYLVKNVDLGK